MLKIFGKTILTDKEYQNYLDSLEARARLMVENSRKEEELKALRSRLAVENSGATIDLDLGDPSPLDREKRKSYVAEVAALHKNVLEPKLKQMISATHTLMEAQLNDRELDMQLKGIVYALRELMKWGESMINEQLANQVGENPGSPN